MSTLTIDLAPLGDISVGDVVELRCVEKGAKAAQFEVQSITPGEAAAEEAPTEVEPMKPMEPMEDMPMVQGPVKTLLRKRK